MPSKFMRYPGIRVMPWTRLHQVFFVQRTWKDLWPRISVEDTVRDVGIDRHRYSPLPPPPFREKSGLGTHFHGNWASGTVQL